MGKFIATVVLVLCLTCNLLGKPPQGPKPEQGPPVKEEQISVKDYKVKKTCPCSPQCECGCNEGKECTCGTDSPDESQLVLFHGRAAQRRQARQSYSYPVQSTSVYNQPYRATTYTPTYTQPTYSPPQRSSWGGSYGPVTSAPMMSSRGSSRGC